MSLLQAEQSITYYPSLAKRTTVNCAIMAQQIYFWQTSEKPCGRLHEGKRWIFNTYEQWADQTGLTPKQVRTAIDHLESIGAVQSQQLDKGFGNQRKFYRVNPDHEIFDTPAEPTSIETVSEGNSIWLTGQVDLPSGADGSALQGSSLNTERTTDRTNRESTPPAAAAPAPASDDERAAMQIAAYIAAKCEEHGTKTGRLNNSGPDCARIIRQLRDIDGISLEDIRKTLDYAWGKQIPGGTLYGEVLLSIKKWRTDEKFLRAYRQAMNQRAESAQPKASRYGHSGPPEGFDYPHIQFDQGGGK